MQADYPLPNVREVRARYLWRTTLFMSGYVAINAAAITGAFDDARGLGAWALGFVVSIPVAAQIWATLAYMRDSDEFIRALMARRFIVATGITLALVSTWGFLESYAHAIHIPGWIAYPLFWAAFAFVTPFIRNSH